MRHIKQNHIPAETRRWYSKVYGGWMGKSIGGTLGMPYEGDMRLLDIQDYDPTISLPAPNDDLDLQLVNLHALEQYGPRLQAVHLSREWLEHVFFPFDEYGYALANLRRGLVPPVAGWFNNPFIDCMGSPIRSELWAMIAPGQPEIAAYYAWQDAQVDHAGGEGMYGEVFFAVIESQAFIESDRDQLIACGLQHIPEQSRVAQAVRHTLACHAQGLTWQESRESILAHFGHTNFTDAPLNVAFTIVGWLYGADFGEAIRIAINCGYDTDCTGATLGSILGIILGAEAIPTRWSDPVGNQVVVSDPIRYLDAPKTLEELTERTLCVAFETQAFWQNKQLANILLARFQEELYNFRPGAFNPQFADGLLIEDTLGLSVAFQDGHPAIGCEQTKSLLITLTNKHKQPWQGELSLQVPAGWSGSETQFVELDPEETCTYVQMVTADEQMQEAYEVTINLTRSHQDVLWHTQKFPVAMVPARHWEFVIGDQQWSEKAIIAGDRLDLPVDFADYTGVVRAHTLLENPIDRKVRFIVSARPEVEVRLDGKILWTTSAADSVLPAFHRAEPGSFYEGFLSEGTHELELIFTRGAQNQNADDIMVMLVADSSIHQPGPYYYFTDILFAWPFQS
ncbi:ADP-ribosylglycohydrolase family protein [Tengunoibacter tsumagoiensis]|uniref:ADP-ribosylglycohydrolase n=1 Tax=Tengunoibacter tsumagoiensis TaxID=2014871 RepID=A0A402A6W8_9CHLR|nr:ADP-ribosylglycohydrolase family protein [Tengunoibacter tsumagoiensis]GCE14890.1 hypothetical protein KTT_47490 [Tengunoibacter tsumagoiensis]